MDVGPKTSEIICKQLEKCRTVIWNGPLGCFEVPPFDDATNTVAQKVAEENAYLGMADVVQPEPVVQAQTLAFGAHGDS